MPKKVPVIKKSAALLVSFNENVRVYYCIDCACVTGVGYR